MFQNVQLSYCFDLNILFIVYSFSNLRTNVFLLTNDITCHTTSVVFVRLGLR